MWSLLTSYFNFTYVGNSTHLQKAPSFIFSTPLDFSEHMMLWLPPVVYTAVFVPGCRKLLEQKGVSEWLLSWRHVHNAAFAIFSAAMGVAAVAHLGSRPLTAYGQLCTPASPAPIMVWAWYLSKFYEWFDSSLLLAQGKELSSLHYNHHASTATVVAAHFVGRPVRTAIFDVPLFLNAAVHAVMYAYYYDPQRLRPIKRWLTRGQIAQHIIVLFAIVYTTATVLAGTPCDVSLAANGLSLCLYTMYLVQFLVFYVGAYIGRKAQHVD
jgi:hypothetical protein